MITKEKPAAKKEARIAVRLSDDHKARIEQAAAMTGQTVNSFVASEMVKRADEIMEKEEMRCLTNRDRDIFLALLDADDEPNEALKAAAKEYKQGHRVGTEYYFEL